MIDIPKKTIRRLWAQMNSLQEINIQVLSKPNTTVHVGQVKKACSIISKAKGLLFLLGGGVSISGVLTTL